MDLVPQFEAMRPFPNLELYAIRIKTQRRVLGYIQVIPDYGWIWYIDATFSKPQKSYDDAMDDLIRNYMIVKMDTAAKKAGVITNEDYVRGL